MSFGKEYSYGGHIVFPTIEEFWQRKTIQFHHVQTLYLLLFSS